MAIVTRPARVGGWHGSEGPPEAHAPGDFSSGDSRTLARAAVWSRRLVVGTLAITAVAGIGLPGLASPITLVVAALGFAAGVPHGAIDHLAAARLAGGRSIILITVAYAGLAAGTWALMTWAGTVALAVVVGLSALHFGLGELHVTRQLSGWRPGAIPTVALVIAGCGALLLPLARSGDDLAAVASAVSPDIAHLLGSAPMQAGLVITWLAAALVTVIAALRSGHRGAAVDVVLIGLLGALASPLVAFAVWFGGWHALRHCARMLSVEPGCRSLLHTGRRGAAIRRFARLAGWPSAGAFTVLAALGWFTTTAPDPTTLVAEQLRLLLALTVPHMVVVGWLDRTPAP
ncbi:hypothetical protein CRM90_15635 [Mycobacterium sp. ENV421]|uniref:Brp/Blh family beta-carotene 15,15'-dioxygenase n=1 Tax=Mycobacterium sp. ENV421 TaxID=1213407 RepID=UPI000C9BDD56|nr:Brp/Blh family beta-carotene 15,15'-dioxygenase [Mycobacterium sp. ENV421]PND56871.1 hypothetical protein CRM90_15635 [Mycobacterium sp. ENV421]